MYVFSMWDEYRHFSYLFFLFILLIIILYYSHYYYCNYYYCCYFSVIVRPDSLVREGYEDVLLSAGARGHVLLDIVKLVVASL